jgi:anhydro-N-acetylmuramic acid kinase
MVYKVLGLMSGSSLDGLDMAYVLLQENGGKWSYEIVKAECFEYSAEWKKRLQYATELSALHYQLLHAEYGHYTGKEIKRFIDQNNLHHQVALICSHGHTTFHLPGKGMTAQLGDGAAIAAETGLPVVTDLRAMDVAFGGQGAPIVPIGEKLLFADYDYFLNLGGIANISIKTNDKYIAFDVCAANRVLNMLAEKKGFLFDEDGKIAASGKVNEDLLNKLNILDYYNKPYPKSLANSFGIEIVYPIIQQSVISIEDAMRTYVEHVVIQIKNAIVNCQLPTNNCQLLLTGGGAFNKFLIERLTKILKRIGISIILPDENVIKFKEALIMALIGVLRWRDEYNVLSSVTGAKRDSIGGAIWMGAEA